MRHKLLFLLVITLGKSVAALGQVSDSAVGQERAAAAGQVSVEPVACSNNSYFAVHELSDSIFQRMLGKSYPKGCTVKRTDLRYLTVLHVDAEGNVHRGELVCNRLIAQDVLDIFKQLYVAGYPIEHMRLIDDYGADDERSMQANNTSCFCFRAVSGTKKLSKHAQGLAIDINPLYNPCVKGSRVQPTTGRPYTNRNRKFGYKIEKGDLLWKLFTEHGFSWGGAWKTLKDYQHFEKD
jgi:hypothetical protein